MTPLFTWAGGKTKVIPTYEKLVGIPKDFDVYVEPYFGGGAMFCELHNRGHITTSHINEANPELYNLYSEVKMNANNLIQVLEKIEGRYISQDYETRKTEYYQVRDAYVCSAFEHDNTLEAAVFYFLLKTSFNGIFQTIGDSPKFATPAGLLKHKDRLFDYSNIREWSDALQGTTITLGDGLSVIEQYGEGSFIFVDPPYRDSFTHYGVEKFDHIGLLEACRNSKADIWYCNRYTDDNWYEDNKGDLKMITFNITYTAGRRKKTEDGFKAVQAEEVLLYK